MHTSSCHSLSTGAGRSEPPTSPTCGDPRASFWIQQAQARRPSPSPAPPTRGADLAACVPPGPGSRQRGCLSTKRAGRQCTATECLEPGWITKGHSAPGPGGRGVTRQHAKQAQQGGTKRPVCLVHCGFGRPLGQGAGGRMQNGILFRYLPGPPH